MTFTNTTVTNTTNKNMSPPQLFIDGEFRIAELGHATVAALSKRGVPVFNAPKPPADRVSLSVATLLRAKHRIVLTTGEGKQQAISQIRNQIDLPVNRIGDIEWFVDAAASGVI